MDKKNYKNLMDRIIDYLIPFFIFIFSIFVSYNKVGSGIINYIDHNFPFYFNNHLNRLIYSWNDYIYLGFNHSLSLMSNISYILIFSFFEKIGFNYILINRLEYASSIFLLIYFTYLFISSLFKFPLNKLQKIMLVITSTFFLTNLLNTALFVTGLSQQIFAFSGVPLALFSLRKYSLTKKKKFLILTLFSCFIITSFNLPYSIISLILVLIFFIISKDIRFNKKIKLLLIFILIWGLINIYWILPMFYSVFIQPPYEFSKSVSLDRDFQNIMSVTASRYTMDQMLKFFPNMLLVQTQNADDSLFVSYFSNIYLIFFVYLIIILILCWNLYVYSMKKNLSNPISIDILLLTSIILLFIFLAKGLNKPFGDIYIFLYNHGIFFKMFRDSFKWMAIPIFAVIILIANILINSNKKIIKIFILIFLIIFLIPWNFGLFERLNAYSVPDYYFQFHDYYKNLDNSNKRALLIDNLGFYASFEFDTNKKKISNNIIKSISPIPIVDLFSNGGGISYEYLKLHLGNLSKSDQDIEIFKKMGLTEIYRQYDIVGASDTIYNYSENYFDKKNFGKIEVFELKKEFISPKIFLSNTNEKPEILFKKINPTKYIISIKNIKEPANINFLYTFDENWGIYLDNRNFILNCKNLETNIITENNSLSKDNLDMKINECKNNYKFFEGEELSYLYKKPIFDDTHQIVYEYANGWTIDPQFLKDQYSNDYYTENPDGSINLKLIMYFKIQSYFYLGLIISGMTLLFCIGYLIYGLRKNNLIISPD